MGKTYFTSDLHIGHNRGFMYEPRGFDSIYDHDQMLIAKWNSIVNDDDIVYILGDIMLNDNEYGRKIFNQLKGIKVIVRGNHDTDTRWDDIYPTMRGVIRLTNAEYFTYGKYHFYLSHYPTMTSNLEKESLKKCLINLYGHTHQKSNFYNDIPFMYHVGMDSHNNAPVDIETIIADCEAKCKECLEML